MKFQLVDRARNEFPIHRPCGVPGVGRSGYLAWKDRPGSRRRRDDMVLLAQVRPAFARANGTYGSPRTTREPRDNGFAAGRRRAARPMCENGRKARRKRRFKRTADSDHAWPAAPNIVDRDFTAAGPDGKWGMDISYVWTREGRLCLAVIVGLLSRRIVGWAAGDRPRRDLAPAAPRKALAMRRPGERPIHRSGRGSQYCSIDYQAGLRRHGIRIPMPGKGNCRGNAIAETFFKRLKSGLAWRAVFSARNEAERAMPATSAGSTIPSGDTRRSPTSATSAQPGSKSWRRAEQMPLRFFEASPLNISRGRRLHSRSAK